MNSELKPLTTKGEIVHCKGCGKVLYEGQILYEYPSISMVATGDEFTYCSRECALKNALIFCVGCGKKLKEGDMVHVVVKHMIGDEDQLIQTINFYCNECKT